MASIDSSRAKKIVEQLGGAGLLDKIEPTSARRAARRPLRRGGRAISDRSMVRRRQDARQAGDRGGARAQDHFRAAAVGSDFLQLDGKHPALVHFAPDLVGSSDSCVVRAGWKNLRRRDGRRCRGRCAGALHRDRRDNGGGRSRHRRRCGSPSAVRGRISASRRGRARYLVFLGAVAVLDARLAGRDAGAQALLSDLRAGDRLRHHLLLGRAHDDDGTALHERGAVP